MNNPQLIIDPAVTAKGIKVHMAVLSVPQVSHRRGSALDQHIKEALAPLKFDELFASPILKECAALYAEVGMKNVLPPAEHLLQLIQRSQMLPNINNVVDAYNIVSAQTLLSLGAHDLAHINGDIQFKLADGTEAYTPLGKGELEKVSPGEYACMDSEKILCRMDIKQCDQTKITKDTTDFIVYAQGNKEASDDYVLAGLRQVCENIEKFCQGTYEIT